MILKYKVPEIYKKIYDTDIIYCQVLKTIEVKSENKKVYLVKMLNDNRTNVFSNKELKKLNLLDRIKILKYKK